MSTGSQSQLVSVSLRLLAGLLIGGLLISSFAPLQVAEAKSISGQELAAAEEEEALPLLEGGLITPRELYLRQLFSRLRLAQEMAAQAAGSDYYNHKRSNGAPTPAGGQAGGNNAGFYKQCAFNAVACFGRRRK